MTLHLFSRSSAAICAAVIVLGGCASSGRAPVEARTPVRSGAAVSGAASANTVPTPAVARPGYYIVKRGDTLYSIAHQFERDYRELASWNGIDDPRIIKVGQELRVVPPEGTGNRPVTPAAVIETKPLEPVSPIAAPPAPTAVTAPSKTVVREPRGGRIAYSAQALKDLQNPEKVAAESPPASSAAAATSPGLKSDSKPAVSQSAATEAKPAEGKPVGEEDLDWAWPSSGKIITAFNDSSNKGVDLSGNIGDPVLAAGAGKVVYVGAGLRGYGNLVIIKHNNSFLSAYAHNSEILVKEGQTVQKGQKIAALGNSDADRAKLHFEIRRQGKPVDPVKYLPSR